MKFGIAENTYAAILNALERVSEIDEAILFGSRAMGNFRPGSDIDIAIRGKTCTAKTATDLSTTLNEKTPLPYLFDIVHYATINNAELKKHIDQLGIVIFSRKNKE